MLSIYEVYTRNRLFFKGFLLWIGMLSMIAFCYPKNISFHAINSTHQIITDILFTFFTFSGDGLCIIGLAALLFFIWKRKNLALSLVITYVVSGLISSMLKKSFNATRPAGFWGEDPLFHSVSWLPLAYHNAFPSGHTTSAFAAATTIALICRDKRISLLCLACACLAGYSRVYLGQHFVEDVWFGSLLGASTSLFCYMLQQILNTRKTGQRRLSNNGH